MRHYLLPLTIVFALVASADAAPRGGGGGSRGAARAASSRGTSRASHARAHTARSKPTVRRATLTRSSLPRKPGTRTTLLRKPGITLTRVPRLPGPPRLKPPHFRPLPPLVRLPQPIPLLPVPEIVGPACDCGCKSWGPFICGIYAPWFGCTIYYSMEQCGWVYYYPGCACFLPLEEIATYPPCEGGCEQQADPCAPAVEQGP